MLDARRREVWKNLQPFASNHYYPDKAGAFTPEEIEGVDKWVDSLLGLQAEAVDAPPALVGDALMAVFYINELMLRLAPRQDPALAKIP